MSSEISIAHQKKIKSQRYKDCIYTRKQKNRLMAQQAHAQLNKRTLTTKHRENLGLGPRLLNPVILVSLCMWMKQKSKCCFLSAANTFEYRANCFSVTSYCFFVNNFVPNSLRILKDGDLLHWPMKCLDSTAGPIQSLTKILVK